MDTRVIDLNGSAKQEFVMAYVQELDLPSWNTIMDEFWLTIVNNAIFDYYDKNRNKIIEDNSNLVDRREYAIALTIDAFASSLLLGEAEKFKDYVIQLTGTVRQFSDSKNSRVYICFYSASTDHFLSAMIDGQFVILGMHMGDAIL